MNLHSRVSIHRWILPCLLAAIAGTSSDASKPVPPLPEVAVVPFVIIPQTLDGAPTRADQDALVRRLAEEASERAERSLLRQHLAAAVEWPSSRASATAPVLLAGTVRLPLSLPPASADMGRGSTEGVLPQQKYRCSAPTARSSRRRRRCSTGATFGGTGERGGCGTLARWMTSWSISSERPRTGLSST